MRNLQRTAAFESEVVELTERVGLLTTRRADIVWKALLDQVHARSAAVVDTLLSACRESTLRRVAAGGFPPVLTHVPPEGCVGELGVQLVLATLRRHLGEQKASSAAETGAPGASERFGISELRRHRAEMRRIYQDVKVELWTSVIDAAMREAGALVVRVEARCSEAELESLRRHLATTLEATPSPLETPGAGLEEVAERVASEQVLAILARHLDPAASVRRRQTTEGPDVAWSGFEPAYSA
jgi:hypothetical protein